MKRWLLIALSIVVVVAAVGTWWLTRGLPSTINSLHLRKHGSAAGALAFNNSERISAVLVQEGDRVHKGQTLARLNTSRLSRQWRKPKPRSQPSAGRLAVAQRQPARGNRRGPGQRRLGQGRRRQCPPTIRATKSCRKRVKGGAVSQQDVDNARTALAVAEAKLALIRKCSNWPSRAPERRKSPRPRPG